MTISSTRIGNEIDGLTERGRRDEMKIHGISAIMALAAIGAAGDVRTRSVQAAAELDVGRFASR